MAARAFHASGYEIMAVTRSGKANGLPANVQQRAADAMDRQSLIRATEGADIIFNGLNPPYTEWTKCVMPMGENVMAAALHHGAAHMFPGNVYNYGRAIAPTVRDDAVFEGTTRKGAIRIQLEKLFEEQAIRHSVRTVILRAGDFYGGALTGSWFDLVIASKIAKRKFTYPGPMDVLHSWAYLPDLAATFAALAGHLDEMSDFETFLFPGHLMTGDELKRNCEAAVGFGLANAGVPWPLLRIGGLVVPMLREICEMAYLWRAPHGLDGQKLEVLLGSIPRTDPRIAVSSALSDLGIGAIAPQANGFAKPA
jgi:nucleoside-diphosphate-sugar epimerase